MGRHTRKLRSCLVSLLAGGAALALGGCGTGISTSATEPVKVTAAAVQGVVMGGQQAVAGVTLQLYQAGTGGYGTAATALGATATTTAAGNFNLPSYTCSSGSQVYLVGTGGTPIGGSRNNNLALMAGLGTCGGTYLNSFINLNELTTVATVWALAPFMSGITNVATSSGNVTGLNNAFAAINEIVTTSNGTISGPTLPAGATLPVTEINTLADILEQCINSAGGVEGDGSNCGNLFALAPNSAGTAFPTDTITAALNIARNPARNVAGLNKLRSSSPAFEPALDVNSPPSAWTIAITYTGGGLSTPTAVATDTAGAVWVANSGNSSVTKLSATGAAVSGGSGFTAGGFSTPVAIAIDPGGNAWVANQGNNTLTELNSSGTSGTVYSGNGLTMPKSIAIDGSGEVFVTNTASVSAFNNSGAALNSASPYTGAGITNPATIAITPR